MKKIGIITITDYNNYGNRLQNYAVQEVLKSLNYDVETIRTMKPTRLNRRRNINKFLIRIMNTFIKSPVLIIKRTTAKVNRIKNKDIIERRIIRFKDFSKKYLKETDYYIHDGSVPSDLDDKFDYIVIGSDQIWNPIFRLQSSVDFASFVNKDKRIAFSPSFGISELPTGCETFYKEKLLEIKHLSVREKAGAEIIKKLTNRDAIVLVDPTMMLDKNKWASIKCESNKKPERDFILTYFLGEETTEIKEMISRIKVMNNFEVVNLANLKHPDFYDIDPSEFIDLLDSCSVFLSDSFHGAVFSILFEKSFIIFNRSGQKKSMNSRIDTLLSTFKLQDRKFENIKKNQDIFEIDFSHVQPILENERSKAYEYLMASIENQDAN